MFQMFPLQNHTAASLYESFWKRTKLFGPVTSVRSKFKIPLNYVVAVKKRTGSDLTGTGRSIVGPGLNRNHLNQLLFAPLMT